MTALDVFLLQLLQTATVLHERPRTALNTLDLKSPLERGGPLAVGSVVFEQLLE